MIDIKKYESVAMIDLPDGERESLGRRACTLTEGFAALDGVCAEAAEPLVTVLNLHNILREDTAEKNITRDEILANAPEQFDGYFQVPGTIVI